LDKLGGGWVQVELVDTKEKIKWRSGHWTISSEIDTNSFEIANEKKKEVYVKLEDGLELKSNGPITLEEIRMFFGMPNGWLNDLERDGVFCNFSPLQIIPYGKYIIDDVPNDESPIKNDVIESLKNTAYEFKSFIYSHRSSNETCIIKAIYKTETTKKLVAIKLINKPEKAQHEINILNYLGQNTCIIQLQDYFKTDKFYSYGLVFDIFASVNEFKPKCPEELQLFMFQLLQALNFCHSKRVIHRDIKPSNIFYKRFEGRLSFVLADFGIAIKYDDHNRQQGAGTKQYMAPEMLSGDEPYDYAVDIWSAGITFGELLNGKHLFNIDRTTYILDAYSDYFIDIDTWLNKVLINANELQKDLFKRMLCEWPENRITAKDAVTHPYFANVNKICY